MMYKYLDGLELPSYLSIEIKKEHGSKHVYVHSTIHKNKEVHLPACYSTAFSDQEILNDARLVTHISKRYGFVKVTKWGVI